MARVLQLYDQDFVTRVGGALRDGGVNHDVVAFEEEGLQGWAIEVAEGDVALAAGIIDAEGRRDAIDNSPHVCGRCGHKMISAPSSADEEGNRLFVEYVCVKCGATMAIPLG